jgi:hypothetical protein
MAALGQLSFVFKDAFGGAAECRLSGGLETR